MKLFSGKPSTDDIPKSALALALSPAMADGVLHPEDFAGKAEAFLRKELPPDLFLDLCDLALEDAEDPEYALDIHKYRFLAYIMQEKLYEALAEAFLVLGTFDDELMHYHMLCTVCLKRSNYYKALDCIERLIEAYAEAGLDLAQLLSDRDSINKYLLRVVFFTAEDFWNNVKQNREQALLLYAGKPILLSGKAKMTPYKEKGVPYLIFRVGDDGEKRILCQTPASEAPFLRHLEQEQDVTVIGSLLNADELKIVMHPCNLLD